MHDQLSSDCSTLADFASITLVAGEAALRSVEDFRFPGSFGLI